MKFRLRLLTAAVIFSLTSCISSKQVIYWQDAVPSKSGTSSNGQGKTDSSKVDSGNNLIIQDFDVLDIKIKSSKQAFDNLLESNVPGIYSFGSPAGGGSSGVEGAGGGSGAGGSVGGEGGYYSGYLVDANGNVTLPVLGKICLKNLTIDEAKKLISTKSKEFILDPYVDIKFLSFKVQILGNVKQPGVHIISNEKANIMEAIALADDLTDFGNSKRVKVLRGDLKKDYKVYLVDLTSLKSMRESDAYYLQPGDIIYVEPLPRKFILSNINTILSTVVIVNTSIILFRLFSGK